MFDVFKNSLSKSKLIQQKPVTYGEYQGAFFCEIPRPFGGALAAGHAFTQAVDAAINAAALEGARLYRFELVFTTEATMRHYLKTHSVGARGPTSDNTLTDVAADARKAIASRVAAADKHFQSSKFKKRQLPSCGFDIDVDVVVGVNTLYVIVSSVSDENPGLLRGGLTADVIPSLFGVAAHVQADVMKFLNRSKFKRRAGSLVLAGVGDDGNPRIIASFTAEII